MNKPDANVVDIALVEDQALQRFLVRRVYRSAEFRIGLKSGREHVGYVTAIDEEWLQLSTAVDDPKAIVIRLDAIEDIEETGEKLTRFPTETQELIHQYSRALKSKCGQVLTGGHDIPKRDPYWPGNGTL